MKDANPVIQSDIMRFKTNKLSSNLTLLGMAFGCLYFLVVYGQYTMAYESTYGILYYDISLGLSVVYNLVFLLLTCLCSIQVKNYNKMSCFAILALAIIQIGRIFWFPLDGINAKYADGTSAVPTSSFVYMVVWLVLSAVCLIVAAVYGYLRATQYANYRKKLEAGEIDIDAILKQADAEAEEVAAAAAKGE